MNVWSANRERLALRRGIKKKPFETDIAVNSENLLCE